MRAISPHPHQHLLLSISVAAMPVGMKWYLMTWLCMSMMTNDIEHLFMNWLAMCTSCLGKCLSKSLVHSYWLFFILNCKPGNLFLPSFLFFFFPLDKMITQIQSLSSRCQGLVEDMTQKGQLVLGVQVWGLHRRHSL